MDAKRYLPVLFVLLAAAFWQIRDSEALPSFARKYRTSCQTCHTAYPKLNPFGVAFRMNGYQWPGPIAEEEGHTKEEPVNLGAPAYKKVFPNAVWPGGIPGFPPVAFHAKTGFTWTDFADSSVATFNRPSLELLLAGTLGEQVSFFVGGDLFEDGSVKNAELERFYLQLDNVGGGALPRHLLYLKIGEFIPELTTYAIDRTQLTQTPFAFSTYSPVFGESIAGGGEDADASKPARGALRAAAAGPALSGPAFGLEDSRLGVQASGMVRGRFRYVLGLVNDGTGEASTGAKDTFGRLSYKWGGMAYDGSGGSGSTRNWAERSVALGVFGYRGVALNPEAVGPRELDVRRAGADVNAYWDRLNLLAGYLHGRDELLEGSAVRKVSLDTWYAESDVVIYPWLLGIVRYEQAKADGFDIARRVVPNLTVLYRANVKFQAEAPLDPDDLELDTVLIDMDFAF